jgi:hypothetical protein
MQLRHADLSWQVAGDDIVVLDLVGAVYLKLNSSGRVLWEALAGSATQAELVSTLVGTYGVDEQRAARDVAAFIDDLRTRGLLTE